MAAATVGRGPMVRPKKASFDGGAADFSQQPARIKAGLFPSYAQSRMRPAGTGLHPRPERLVPREMGYFSSCSLCKSLLQRRRSQQLVWGCFLVSRGAFFSSRFCSIPASPAGCDVWGWMAFGASLANECRAGQKPRCKQRSQPSPARTHGDAVPLAAVLPFSAVLLPPAQVSWYQVTRPSREICSPEAPEKMSGMQVRCCEPCAPLLLGVRVGGRCSEPPLTSSPPSPFAPPGRLAIRYRMYRQVQLPRYRRAGPAVQQGRRPHHRCCHQGNGHRVPGRWVPPSQPLWGSPSLPLVFSCIPRAGSLALLSPQAGNRARRWVN